MSRIRLSTAALAALLALPTATAAAWSDGELRSWLRASSATERRYAMPHGLLRAMALVESGRGGIPWAWTLNVDGRARYYKSRAEAVRALLAAPRHKTDVGLMQVNLGWHGRRFARPADALDPRRNLEAAAAFLAELHAEHGTWTTAVGRYHGGGSERRRRYVCRVYEALRAIHRRPASPAARTLCGAPS